MNVSLTNVDSVNAILKVEINQADYQEKVTGALKNFRKKANIPGFRPGAVPMGMVKKMYGKSILAEEVNKLVGEGIYNYINENKLNVLGEPLPNIEKQQAVDFGTEGDYEFFFDLGLAPEIKLSLTKRDKVEYYKIAVDEELVDKQVASYKANYGTYKAVEEGAKDTDLLKGIVTELDAEGKPLEGGIVVEDGVLMPSYMKDETEKAKFVGAKVGDVITMNPAKAYDGNEAEIASFLHLKKEDLTTISPEFSFEVKDVTRYKEAEMNQEFFDRIFGKDVVKTEADFREKVKENISNQLAPDSDYKFLLDAKALLEKKVGDLQYPDAFLKRWLLTTGKDKTPEAIEEDYPKIMEDLKFHLIKEEIAKANDLKIEEADLKEVAIMATQAQFAQYGMMNVPADVIENYAAEMVKNNDQRRNLLDKAMENKIIEFLKKTLGLKEVSISLNEFKKFFEPAATDETEK
ncbi:trigger factor [Dysgonomonas sp. PH5-45]|uniref:trigger factor n=1 Tax=unclassified Dysgonomonas TaxID=2630389 RepID=UPI0024741B99|nr:MULTISPECIES: trigger factor [unclassified Dysgonomonas]MDH6354932.1 trigger factor [Dysgonomonas sp. PH5-45]MDH6387831.1 trigger factor [Dysgonomonas sp. PH5-37]